MNRYSQSYESLVNIGTAFLHVDLLHHANCFICWQLGHSGPMSTPPSFSTAPSLSSLSEKKKLLHFSTAPSLSLLCEKKKTFMFHYLEGGRDLIDVFRMPSSQLYGLMRNIVASFQFHHCLAFPLFILISSRAEVARRFGLGRRRCRLACPRGGAGSD